MEKDNKVIGKVSATEKNPSTIESFYFWTDTDKVLSPFDVVEVENLDNSRTYGVIEEINHVTDSASHFASYISSEFGSIEKSSSANTNNLAFNYVKAKVVGNTKGLYTPVMHGSQVCLCSVEHIREALGLKEVKHGLPCGYLEMYGEQVPVEICSDFLIGPDGAHLNVSGISGLACKTSYSMFLMNSLQQYVSKKDTNEPRPSTAFVIFNVKGRDLLSIDEEGIISKDDKKLYEMLGLKAKPFEDVHYYYPYSSDKSHSYMQTYADPKTVDGQFILKTANRYFYGFESCKEKLEYLFANEPDPTGTMDNIITHIANDGAPFANVKGWDTFKEKLDEVLTNSESPARKDISLQSWKKFSRIIKKVTCNSIFSDHAIDGNKDVDLTKNIVKNLHSGQVNVVDISRLDEKLQGFVFGDVMESIIDLMSGRYDDSIPSKIVVFVDELNKYASTDTPKNSPILRQLLEVTERGRSLGIILFSVEQFRSAIHDRVKGNCATSAFGRTNFVEVSKSDYRFLENTYKSMMTRLLPGEYIITNPALRSLIKIKFPRPTYKENK